MKKAEQAAFAAIYTAGALTVTVLTVLAAAGPRFILFPDAMLPMDLRELAGAWLAIGFLPMLLVSMQLYKGVRRRVVFLPAGVCLLAVLFWVGVWTVGMVRSPAQASGGDIVLPEAEKIEAVRFTSDGLDLTMGGDAFVARLLQYLSQAKDTGRDSVQDVPGAEVVRIDLHFRRLIGKGRGGTSTVFLYREGDTLLLEQPYQGIYQVDGPLESWLREQIAAELGRGVKQ